MPVRHYQAFQLREGRNDIQLVFHIAGCCGTLEYYVRCDDCGRPRGLASFDTAERLAAFVSLYQDVVVPVSQVPKPCGAALVCQGD